MYGTMAVPLFFSSWYGMEHCISKKKKKGGGGGRKWVVSVQKAGG